MFEDALAYIGLQIAKLQFRTDVDQVQSLTTFLRTAGNVLITLPVDYEDSVIAGNALKEFRRQRENLKLTVVNNSTWSTALADFPRCEVVHVDAADIGRLSLPKKALLERVLHSQFDVAVDLNLDFVLHTAYICKASRARVRVGFAHAAADLFFNVQVRIDRRRTPQATYERFAACLSMF